MSCCVFGRRQSVGGESRLPVMSAPAVMVGYFCDCDTLMSARAWSKVRLRGFQILVRDVDLLFERVQVGVAEHGPPIAAQGSVGRVCAACHSLYASGGVSLNRRDWAPGCPAARTFRPDAMQPAASKGARSGTIARFILHSPSEPAMRTGSPETRESAGFTISLIAQRESRDYFEFVTVIAARRRWAPTARGPRGPPRRAGLRSGTGWCSPEW